MASSSSQTISNGIENDDMAHQKDYLGFPVDPQLRRLENHLGKLAAAWRGTYDQNIIREYEVTLNLMYELGWEDILDIESELPDKFMPSEYKKRHPR